MPKLKKQYDPWERYRGAVVGRMFVLDYGLAESWAYFELHPVK